MSSVEQPAAADATVASPPTDATELLARLEQLKAAATQQYSLKNYDAAANLYSDAAQIQEQINGELSPDNADLLYQYGRCLYHVAVANSDVLGGKVASAEEPKQKKRKVARDASSSAPVAGSSSGSGAVSDALKVGEENAKEKEPPKKQEEGPSKPFFQITGDENFTDSEDEDEADEDEADEEGEEEENDFATAFEILDVARILFTSKLQALENENENNKSTTENPEQRQLKERLADTHDLQAEICLENEHFEDAVNDTRQSLRLKLELFPEESSLIAEAHFKLSLALEFASVITPEHDEPADDTLEAKPTQIDEKLREEAALEMERAIASCKLRVAKEEATLAAGDETHKAKVADVKEIVADMEQRLVDLRNPAVSVGGMGGSADDLNNSEVLQGVLGAMLGQSKADQKKRIAEATEQANDLSGLVKHKKKPKADSAAAGREKRKAEDEVDGSGKKVKFEANA